MNINPNLFDFERNIIYTRKRNEPSIQYSNYGLSNMSFPVNFNKSESEQVINYDNIYNKKECRNDLQHRYASYEPIPSTQAYPLFDAQNNDFFFSNAPINTRINKNI